MLDCLHAALGVDPWDDLASSTPTLPADDGGTTGLGSPKGAVRGGGAEAVLVGDAVRGEEECAGVEDRLASVAAVETRFKGKRNTATTSALESVNPAAAAPAVHPAVAASSVSAPSAPPAAPRARDGRLVTRRAPAKAPERAFREDSWHRVLSAEKLRRALCEAGGANDESAQTKGVDAVREGKGRGVAAVGSLAEFGNVFFAASTASPASPDQGGAALPAASAAALEAADVNARLAQLLGSSASSKGSTGTKGPKGSTGSKGPGKRPRGPQGRAQAARAAAQSFRSSMGALTMSTEAAEPPPGSASGPGAELTAGSSGRHPLLRDHKMRADSDQW